jgi:spore coat protein U-like protein
MRRIVMLAAAIAAIPATSIRTIEAQSSTASLQVTANVIKNCTISTAPISFGAYDPVTANSAQPLDGIGTITITCTRGVSAHIALGNGANPAGAVRRMGQGASSSFLAYQIYKDASRTEIWGNDFSNNLDVPTAPSVDPRTYTAYGRIPGAQDANVGSYVDVVLATVNF